MEQKKISVDEWIKIATDVLTTFCDKYSDDGKISVSDGLAIIVVLLKDIAAALKNA